MPSPARDSRSNDELIRANRGFYESLWADAHLMDPQRFNTWPLVRELVATAPRRLEVAPGLRPRLPLEDTCFIDLSHAALRQLRARGANTAHGMIGALPCASASFDLVCALDILEHVADDEGALRELARVAAPGATV
jgi:SAM-dependent methyltransferase